MDPNTAFAWVAAIRDGGFLLMVVIALVAGARGWYVWKWQHEVHIKLLENRVEDFQQRLEDAYRERDRWMATALRGTAVAERAVETHEGVFDAVRSLQDARWAERRASSLPPTREGS